MATFKDWTDAARPRTLPLSLSGIIIGSGIAFSQGYISWIIFALALATTISFQILSNLANDYGDGVKGTDNDTRIGPDRAIQSGAISVKMMRNAILIFTLISFVFASLLIHFGTQKMPVESIYFYALLAVFCVIAAITYTVGKRAYGYHGMGDIMVFIFFGLVAVMGVYTLFSKTIDWLNLLPSCTIGFLSTAVLNLNNMRDRSSDILANKNTLVVKIGANRAKYYHTLLILGAMFTWVYFLSAKEYNWEFFSLLPFLVLAQHLKRVARIEDAKAFDPELKVVSLATFAISILFFITIWI